MKQRERYWIAALGAGTAVVVSAVVVGSELYALSPRGSVQELLPSYMAMFPIMACMFLFPLACILLAPRRTRRVADAVATFCLAYLVIGMLGVFVAGRTRAWAFDGLARRSEPLVAAIHAFEEDAGRPPAGLHELVPHYLRAVPGTGMVHIRTTTITSAVRTGLSSCPRRPARSVGTGSSTDPASGSGRTSPTSRGARLPR